MFIRLENIIDWLLYSVLQLDVTQHLVQALDFFVYDTIKIFLLLVVIIHIMTLLNKYLPVEKIRNFLVKRKRYWLDHLFASFFGTITPFCSCSSIPLFVGFLKSGIPLGVTLSFLITSPLVNEVAIALFLWIFGVKITIAYVVAGVVLWTVGGFVLGKLGLEKYIAGFVHKAIEQWKSWLVQFITPTFSKVWREVVKDSWALIKKIMLYVTIWVAIWGLIHWFIPTGFFETYLTRDTRYGVPLAVLVWIPMYTNASGVIPVVQSIIVKWVPLWTGLAFMMAVVGLSFPEFLILKKVMKMKLLFLFFGIIWVCMMIIWYLFNFFL